MEVDYPPYAVMNLIHGIGDRVSFARELSHAAGAIKELFDLYDEVEASILKLKLTIEDGNFTMDYVNQLAESLNKIMGAFPRSYGTNERGTIKLQEEERLTFKRQQEQDKSKIEETLRQFKTTSTFFTHLDFLNRDLVIIGANGSGKTSLAKHLTSHIKRNGILVSAQRVLKLPAYESIRSYATTFDYVKAIQLPDEESEDRHNLADEFGILIEHLLADDSRALKQNRSQRDDPFPPPTKLQVLLMMWNGLFSHLQLTLPDDINIGTVKDSLAFHVSKMSDGEKVALFLIAHVLLCPENGFVIVDEPEMYLHPTIHKELWDRLEDEDKRFSLTSFVRGTKKSQHLLKQHFRKGTGYYIGEWHSHPRFSLNPSLADIRTMMGILHDPNYGVSFVVLLIVHISQDEMKHKGFFFHKDLSEIVQLE